MKLAEKLRDGKATVGELIAALGATPPNATVRVNRNMILIKVNQDNGGLTFIDDVKEEDALALAEEQFAQWYDAWGPAHPFTTPTDVYDGLKRAWFASRQMSQGRAVENLEDPLQPEIPTGIARYRAEFEPQVWVSDDAMPVDPLGPTEWDCTKFITKLLADKPALRNDFLKAVSAGGWLDKDDALVNDPAAPAWTRQWAMDHPFTIAVYEADPQPSVQEDAPRIDR